MVNLHQLSRLHMDFKISANKAVSSDIKVTEPSDAQKKFLKSQ
jgi:hypothetical protein